MAGEPPADTTAVVVARMKECAPLVAGDERRHFHATYLRITMAIGEAVAAGLFRDGEWLERLEARFANFYLDALEAYDAGQPVPRPWQIAFAAADETDLPPLRHVLLGMNAHINLDLPQAVVAMVGPAEFADPAIVSRRQQDHSRVDEVLARRVAAEDQELRNAEVAGDRSFLDQLLTPLNRIAVRRFVSEARAKVWLNARALDRARALGPEAYAATLGRLEDLTAERVADLRRPGLVVLRLARRGFGVRLADWPPR